MVGSLVLHKLDKVMLQFGQVMVCSVASRGSKELLQKEHEELSWYHLPDCQVLEVVTLPTVYFVSSTFHYDYRPTLIGYEDHGYGLTYKDHGISGYASLRPVATKIDQCKNVDFGEATVRSSTPGRFEGRLGRLISSFSRLRGIPDCFWKKGKQAWFCTLKAMVREGFVR